MKTEQAPESCPFCGAGIIIMADGRECRSQNQWVSFRCFTNWHRNYREPRKLQSSICEDGERLRLICENQRLTRERDEEAAKADHLCVYSTSLETANRQLNKERDDILARVKRLATDGDRMDLLLRCESGIEDTEEWANATREMQLAMIAKAQRDWRKAKEAKP